MKPRSFLAMVCGMALVVPPSEAASIRVPLQNAGFEQPTLPAGGRSLSIDGWIHGEASSAMTAIVDSGSDGMNRAKQGKQWLVLEGGTAVGQRLGQVDSLLQDQPDADRFLVALTVSTLQQPSTENRINLAVELHTSASRDRWQGGKLIASTAIIDLSNDLRGDWNSYLDASVVLKFDRDLLEKVANEQWWLVLRNRADHTSQVAPVTIDEVTLFLASPPPARRLPNIVIVFQDDMGYGDSTAMYPQSKIETPNLDRLAREGMRFLDAHAAATICGPSRIGLLTGTMPSKLGVRGNFAPGGNERLGPPTFAAGTPTIATLCQAAGYDTAVVGKWGIPSNWNARLKAGTTEPLTHANADRVVDFTKPLENADVFGFRYRYLFDENRPFFQKETAAFEENPQPFGWHENGFAVRDVLTHTQDKLHEYYLRAITDRAVRYIQTKAGLRPVADHDFRIEAVEAPFYLHYLTHAPHLPIVPAAQFVGKSTVGPYGDFVIDLDYSLGRIMRALEESELSDNTLVIFSADNGPEHQAYERAAETGHYSMGPLRGVKRDLYEGGHRVPLVVRWPAVVKPNVSCTAMVSLVDWYATIARIVGQIPDDRSGLDSMSLLPLLDGTGKEVRGWMLQDTCVNEIVHGLRVGPWMWIDSESGELNRRREPAWFRRLRNVEDAPGRELYHLHDDLGQGKNRVAEQPQRAADMQRLAERLWADGVRSTPPFAQQIDSDHDGYSDFYEEVLGTP